MLALPVRAFSRDSRPAYRPWRVRVARVERLGPSFRRVRFAAAELAGFGADGLDQRIKLLFPDARGRISDVGLEDADCLARGGWYERWRATPTGERSPLRTYTVREIRPDQGELDVDFVVHRPAGPAGEWLARAADGDELVVVGPDARSLNSASGIDWRPGDARELLLVGDETAVPAVMSILHSLSPGTRATAFLSVPCAGDRQEVHSRADVRVVWLPREGGADRLIAAVDAWAGGHRDRLQLASAPQRLEDIDDDRALLWESPCEGTGAFYAWLAGEASMITELRRLLVRGYGVDRSRVAFMGYWRRGRSELQE